MTREEAIRRIKDFGLHHAIKDLPYSMLTVEAFDMAIRSLEAWEKVKEEIKEKADFIRHSSGHLKDYDAGQWKALLDALEIIDKHLKEVENEGL